MTNKEEAKKKDIIEFIRLRMLQPENLDSILNLWIQQGLAVSGKSVDIKEVSASVRKRILENAFIEQFVAPFQESFSQEEIQQLITFYQADSMKKFLKNHGNLVDSIYEAYREVIREVTA